MSSVDRERSLDEGEPIRFYRFARGAVTWCYNSSREELTHAEEVYAPASITRSAIRQGPESGQVDITITMPVNLDVAENWRPYPPSDPVILTIYVRHVGETDALVEWIGRCVAPVFTDAELELRCEPGHTLGRQESSIARYTRGCGVPLYSVGPGMCNLDPDGVEIPAELDTVDGAVVTAVGFLLAPRSLIGGVLQWLDGMTPMERDIIAHDGVEVTLSSGDASLVAELEVTAVTSALWVEGTVSDVTGLAVTVPGLDAYPDNWFAGGFIEWTRDDGLVERRSIGSHVGNVVTVQYGALDLLEDLELRVYPGCAHTWAACGLLENQLNYQGALWMPGRTPFDGNPVW